MVRESDGEIEEAGKGGVHSFRVVEVEEEVKTDRHPKRQAKV